MSPVDDCLDYGMEGIYVDSAGRTQIKDSHIDNIMTHKVKDLLDRLLVHGNIIMTDTDTIMLQWTESKGKVIP
jgi:hypothetical protein